jgi:hypothetical protein
MRLSDLPLTGIEKFLLSWAIVVTLLLLAAGFAALWQDGSPRLRRLLIGSLVLSAAVLAGVSVFARDLDGRYAASPLKPWFDSLRSGKGPCCSDADGWALADVDWESRGGRYRVRVPRDQFLPSKDQPTPPAGIVMVWIDVEDDAVITEPNRAGRTMVWPIWGYDGLTIRCFMPGSMT